MQDMSEFFDLPADFQYQYGARLRLVVETEKGRFEFQHEGSVPDLQTLVKKLQKVCAGAKLADEVSTPLKPAPTALPGVPAGASLRSPATSSAAGAGAAAGTSKVAVKVARRPITKRPVTFHSDEVPAPDEETVLPDELEFASTSPVSRPPGRGSVIVSEPTRTHNRRTSDADSSSARTDSSSTTGMPPLNHTDSFAPPPKLRGKFDAVCFGRDISETIASQSGAYPELNMPVFFKAACEFIARYGISVEGIFRLSGSIDELAGLKAASEAGQMWSFDKGSFEAKKRAAAMGDLLGAYLRELPEPIIPRLCQENLINNAEGPKDMQLMGFQEALDGLVMTHLEPLLFLLQLFWVVSLNQKVNSMGPNNLGVCMAVNMMRLEEPTSLDPSAIAKMQEENEKIVKIVEVLVEEYPAVNDFMVKRHPELEDPTSFPTFYSALSTGKDGKPLGAMARDSNGRVWTADTENNSSIHIFNPGEFTHERTLETEHDKIFGLLPIGNTMVVGSRSSIQIFNCDDYSVTVDVPSSCICFAYINNQLWCGGSAQIQILDAQSLDEIDIIDYPVTGMCQAICIVGNNVWAAHSTGSIVVVSKETFEVVKEIKGSFPPRVSTLPAVNGKVWCPCKDGAIRIYDGETCKPHHRILAHKKPVLHLTKVGNCIWSTSADGSLRLWHATTFAHLSSVEDYLGNDITSIGLVPNTGPEGCRGVWCGGSDGNIIIFKTRDANPEEIRQAVQNVPRIKQEIQKRKVMAERQKQLAAQEAEKRAREEALGESEVKRLEKERKKQEKEMQKQQQRQVLNSNVQKQQQVLQQMQVQYKQMQFQYSQMQPQMQAQYAAQMQVQYTALQRQQQYVMMLQRQLQQADEKGLNRLKSWTKQNLI